MKAVKSDAKVLNYQDWLRYLDWCAYYELNAHKEGYMLWLEEVGSEAGA